MFVRHSFLLPCSTFQTLHVRFGTLHGLFKLASSLLVYPASTSCARSYSVMDFCPTALNGPNTPLRSSFKLWLFLPWFIRSYLALRNYSVMDFFPTAQSCFPTVQTHRCHRWSKHPCSEPPIHILFAPLKVPNPLCLVVLLLFLTLTYFSPSSTLLTPSPILPQYFLRVYTS